jgi:hypothetical protein
MTQTKVKTWNLHMMKIKHEYPRFPSYQKGVTTLLTGMFILLLMTIMTFFAVNVGLFEQRTSANEYRAKQAFKSSEAGLNTLVEYVKANQRNMVSERTDGWFNAGSVRWAAVGSATCAAVDKATAPDDPCAYVSPSLTNLGGTFYRYVEGGQNFLPDTLMGLTTGGDFRVTALLCITADLDGDALSLPDACVPRAGSATEKLAVQLIAFGDSDDDLGQAKTSIVVAPIRLLNAEVDSPVVVANTFSAGGNFTLVANPNGGGPGVPLSVWADSDVDISSGGSAQTCNLEEYFRDGNPFVADVGTGGDLTSEFCTDCSCPGAPSDAVDLLTGSASDGIDILDIDSDQGPVPDATNFPDDVFAYVFGLSASKWKKVRKNFEEVDDCNGIEIGGVNEKHGLIWVNGSCSIQGGAGSAEEPLLLVIAGTETAAGDLRMNGNDGFYGLIFVTGAPHDYTYPATVSLVGGPIIFGAVISDTTLDLGAGAIDIVYNKEVLSSLQNNDNQAWGAFPGTWADY